MENEGKTYRQPDMYQDDLETSDYLRDKRFPAGWWIVPMIIIGLACWVGAIYLATKYWG